MTRTALLAIALATSLAGPAFAQSAPPSAPASDERVAGSESAPMVLAQRGDDSRSYRDRSDRNDWRDRSDEHDMGRRGGGRSSQQQMMSPEDMAPNTWQRGGRGWGGMPMAEHAWRMMGSGQARFRLRRGDSAVDISCPGGTDLTACVDAASQLLDKLGSGASSAPAPSSAPPASPTPPANR
jgi:hypothetical protein